jgi:hypothetical protein
MFEDVLGHHRAAPGNLSRQDDGKHGTATKAISEGRSMGI